MSLCSFFKICIKISQYYELKLISLYERSELGEENTLSQVLQCSNMLRKKYNLKQVKMCWRGKGWSLIALESTVFFFSQKNWYPVVGMTAPEGRKAHYRVLKTKLLCLFTYINNSVRGIKRLVAYKALPSTKCNAVIAPNAGFNCTHSV